MWFRRYLYSSGIIANLLFLVLVGFIARSIYWQGLPLPLYSKKVAAEVRVNYPSISFVIPVLDFIASLEVRNYYYRQFDIKKWNGAGAKLNFEPNIDHSAIVVRDPEGFIQALKIIKPGQQILLESGKYEFNQTISINTDNSEKKILRITGRDVSKVEFVLKGEGIVINSPNVIVENITFTGGCTNHNECHHALHIVGKSKDVIIRNNIFRDFNAAVKANGFENYYPDRGRVENNTFYNLTSRNTNETVAPLDLVAVNDWYVSSNLFSDIQKSGGDQVSYAAYMKGNSSGGIFERNLVICESNIRGLGLIALGISFGGGGTRIQYARDKSLDTEARDGIIRNNVIMHCPNDVGVYINKSNNIKVYNNFIYNTVGVDVRYKESSAIFFNNVISGRISSREKAIYTSEFDFIIPRSFFTGKDMLKNYYKNPDLLDFSKIKDLPVTDVKLVDKTEFDFCGEINSSNYIGAWFDIQKCRKL